MHECIPLCRWRFEEEDSNPDAQFLPYNRRQRLDDPMRLELGAASIPTCTSQNAYDTQSARGAMRKRTAAEAALTVRHQGELDIPALRAKHRRLLKAEAIRQEAFRRERQGAGCCAEENGAAHSSAQPSSVLVPTTSRAAAAHYQERQRKREDFLQHLKEESVAERERRLLQAPQQRQAKTKTKKKMPKAKASTLRKARSPAKKASPSKRPRAPGAYKLSQPYLAVKVLEAEYRHAAKEDEIQLARREAREEAELEERHARDWETWQAKRKSRRRQRERARLARFEREREDILRRLADK